MIVSMADVRTYTASETDRIRRFVVETGEPLAPPGRHHYMSATEAHGNPIAEAVLAVPGVQEAMIENDSVLVLRRDDFPWEDLEDRVGYAINTALRARDAGEGTAEGADLSDDQIYEIVDRVFRREVNPAVAQHGGRIELIDVQDGAVVVRMMGGCQGCGMANVTLRQGIESQLRRVIPRLRGIQDITDHAAGENPYFK
jgi:NFU1 iron-sulfur cluster scaffold homolog, mitochondrial